MTAEDPADTVIEQSVARGHTVDNEVIEQAAKVGAEAIYWTLEWEQLDDDTRSDAIEFARALHAAGLLADPADRDGDCDGRILRWGKRHEARAERAEAERDEWLTKFREAQAEIGQVRQVCREADGQRERAEAERDHAKEALALAEKDRQTYHRDAIRAEAAANDHYAMALKCSEEALAVAKKLRDEQAANEALREQLGIEVRSREQWESNAERAEAEAERAQATVEHITELAFEHNGCSGCQTPWWLRQALGSDFTPSLTLSPAEQVEALTTRAERAETERDELRATVDRLDGRTRDENA